MSKKFNELKALVNSNRPRVDLAATGERIRYYRTLNGLTLEELAEILLVSPQAISKWQQGKTLPTVDNCIVLCSVFRVRMEDLLVREDDGSSYVA